jgi:putative hydrolase of the HAD superfamily
VNEPLPDPRSVRTLLLDAGGVLVRPSFTRVAQALEAHGVVTRPEALVAAETLARKDMDAPPALGRATDEERAFLYFDLVLDRAGIARSAARDAALRALKRWHDEHNLWEDVLEGVRPGLARLRQAGLRLAVVSNANGTVERLFERLDLVRFFDAIVDSQVEGVEKPDPRLFERALERAGGERETALHVGDLYHVDVVGARAARLRAVLVDEGGLYPGADCPRVRSLAELAAHLVPEVGAGRHFW